MQDRQAVKALFARWNPRFPRRRPFGLAENAFFQHIERPESSCFERLNVAEMVEA